MLTVQIGIFNHVSYLDAFVVVWAFCVAGVTFHFSQTLPVLGYGVRALQNLYLPPENDKAKQQSSMVQLIKERYAQQNSNGRAGDTRPLPWAGLYWDQGPCCCSVARVAAVAMFKLSREMGLHT